MANYFLNETNPEIFAAIPRPGGLANIKIPVKSKPPLADSSRRHSLITVQLQDTLRTDKENYARHHKIQQSLASVPWSIELGDLAEDREKTNWLADTFQDSVDLLSILMSTVMLLSKRHEKIPENFYRWSLAYLKCVKDDFGRAPPNVQGIINHINYITGGKVTSILEDEPLVPGKKFRISELQPEVFG
ncbi:uncharacterized protein LOC132698516 [Cylas formicarius]|uniref:uncharacterized protein LOC132698516 n=1 Tax=Cylas formicarius TaxID=197179 RepID=UPI002958D88E|nr:uncharacterized protein LOC132698516 [Cylas formicarius]